MFIIHNYYLKKEGEYKMFKRQSQLVTISGLLLALAPVLTNGVSLVLIGEPKVPTKLTKIN